MSCYIMNYLSFPTSKIWLDLLDNILLGIILLSIFERIQFGLWALGYPCYHPLG